MRKITEVNHFIQKNVLSYLTQQKIARFRDMRPLKTDTNLYSYHLKLLQKNGFVEKMDDGYTLTVRGMSYVDRISAESVRLSVQPKVVTMLVIQNGYGGVLMYQKTRQPFIDQWTLPFGKVYNNDASITQAAKRETKDKIGDVEIALHHAGDCYVRVRHDDEIKISTLIHVFYGTTDLELAGEHLKWVKLHAIDALDTAPAIDQIIARTFFKDPYFFEEFTVDW